MSDEEAVPRRQALWLSASVALVVLLVWLVVELALDPFVSLIPPLLLWTLPVGGAVSLLLGFRAGNVAFVACLVALVVYFRYEPPHDVQMATARFALVSSLITLQIFVWGFQSTFARAQGLLSAQQRLLELRVAEHARLVQTLVED